MKRKALAVFLISAAACAAQAIHYLPLLPLQIASHFGMDGRPNGWMRRGAFIGLNLGIVALLVFVFLGMARKFATTREEEIHLPSRAYWMAPERRGETVEFISGYFLWFGAGTMLLLLDVFHQVFRYNLFLSKALEHPLVSLGAYAAFVAAWIAGFHLRFRSARK